MTEIQTRPARTAEIAGTPESFFLADGRIDYPRALAAGRRCRSAAVCAAGAGAVRGARQAADAAASQGAETGRSLLGRLARFWLSPSPVIR
ncbi:hypothetical protein LNKW23_13820 [Paralimibaculum aggregatum]|uniref:Uncharacterized protein n=1 Tax=Paralimibaculum aggregatum TaxID=3036245 RepID=A0ABQ6LNG3_9RHOB|nr:hypothetical protein [Limibaculum sp. NKW23]GMG82169.1 hypothetical protein LNKW23_13820 [Limibaculum sp. NKW23]